MMHRCPCSSVRKHGYADYTHMKVRMNATIATIILSFISSAHAQEGPAPKPKSLPNPYRLEPNWPTLPSTMKGPGGRKWGQVIRVQVAPNGNIWVFHRCFNDQPNGDATCINRGEANPPLLEFNPAGKLLRSIGVGLFANPHGFTIDKDGNLWTSDTNDKETSFDMPAKNAAGELIGQRVFKITPAGKVLQTIGMAGGGSGPYLFDRPTGVAVAANGDVFVADGHLPNKSNTGRIVKYSADGKFIKAWGKLGSEPGDFNEPHDINIGGSKGYVYVADRRNNRVQVFDQDGNLVAAWKQFGQPSSVYVDKHDNLYVGSTYQSSGSLFGPTTAPNDRAIVIGNAITGELKYLIPDPGDLTKMTDTGTSASGIASDDQGNIYVADVGFNNLRKYVKVR